MRLQLSTINSHSCGCQVEKEGVPPDALKWYHGSSVAHQPPSVLTLWSHAWVYHLESCHYLSYRHRGQGWLAELSPQIIMYPTWVGSSVFFRNGTININVFHFGLLVAFHIANLRLEVSGNEVTPGKNRNNLDPVKFPMYTCMYVYLQLPSFLPPYKCTFTNSHQLIVLVDGLWYLGFGTQTARSLSSGAILMRFHCRVVFNFSSIWTERGWECEKGGCEVEEGV